MIRYSLTFSALNSKYQNEYSRQSNAPEQGTQTGRFLSAVRIFVVIGQKRQQNAYYVVVVRVDTIKKNPLSPPRAFCDWRLAPC